MQRLEEHPDYCITTGTFARMCGTTRDTLRYYQEQGILVPRKKEENGYYYYSYAQISSFYFIRTFRQLGCSAADIRNYLLAGEEARFDTFVDRQYRELLAQKADLERKITMIEVTRALLGRIRQADVGHPVLCQMAAMRLVVTRVRSQPAGSSGEIMSDIRRHMEACMAQDRQPFPMGASIRASDFMEEKYSYRQVFSFTGDDGEGIEQLPEGRAVVYVCRDSNGAIRDNYRRLAFFLRENHFVMKSDVYCLSIVNVIDPHEERRYLKYLFVCV